MDCRQWRGSHDHDGIAMNSPAAGGDLLIRRKRDLRIDFVRGLALLIIFVDHNAFLDRNAYGWLTSFTLGRYSFIDAADVFFFISGYVSGIIYTDVLLKQGLVASLRKAFKRCLHLYIAEIVLFLCCSALILTAPLHDTIAPWSAFHRLRDLPGDTLRDTLTLKNPPPFFGLLPIYIVFIGLTPIAVWLRIHRPLILVVLSVGSYLAAQSVSGLQAFTYSDGFDPFAWQLLFFGGVLIGFGRVCSPGKRWCPSPKLVAAAIGGLLLIAFLRVAPSEKVGAMFHTHVLGQVVPQGIPLTGKQNVEPLRMVNLSLWLIVVAAVSPAHRFFRNWVVRIPLVCGQNSLVVFCASVFLNYVVLIYARAASGGKALQLAWNAAGCSALVATAAGWSWLRSQSPSILKTSHREYGFRPYLKWSFHYLGALVYAIWHSLQDLFSSGLDV
jgi:hypothetical protein